MFDMQAKGLQECKTLMFMPDVSLTGDGQKA